MIDELWFTNYKLIWSENTLSLALSSFFLRRSRTLSLRASFFAYSPRSLVYRPYICEQKIDMILRSELLHFEMKNRVACGVEKSQFQWDWIVETVRVCKTRIYSPWTLKIQSHIVNHSIDYPGQFDEEPFDSNNNKRDQLNTSFFFLFRNQNQYSRKKQHYPFISKLLMFLTEQMIEQITLLRTACDMWQVTYHKFIYLRSEHTCEKTILRKSQMKYHVYLIL